MMLDSRRLTDCLDEMNVDDTGDPDAVVRVMR